MRYIRNKLLLLLLLNNLNILSRFCLLCGLSLDFSLLTTGNNPSFKLEYCGFGTFKISPILTKLNVKRSLTMSSDYEKKLIRIILTRVFVILTGTIQILITGLTKAIGNAYTVEKKGILHFLSARNLMLSTRRTISGSSCIIFCAGVA